MESIKDFIEAISEELQTEYAQKYTLLGTGRNRTTYDTNDGWVVKIPLNMYGMEDNLAECNIYNETAGMVIRVNIIIMKIHQDLMVLMHVTVVYVNVINLTLICKIYLNAKNL